MLVWQACESKVTTVDINSTVHSGREGLWTDARVAFYQCTDNGIGGRHFR